MAGIRVALQIERLRQPLKKSLHTASQFAFDGVQIDARRQLKPDDLTETGLRQFRKTLDDLNLQVSSVSLPTRSGLSSAERTDQRVAALSRAMQFASRLGARVLLTNLGDLPSDSSPQKGLLTDVLVELCSLGHRIGVEIALAAPAVAPASLAGYFSELPERAGGFDLDPASLLSHGTSPADAVEQLGAYVLHVCANDAVANAGSTGATWVELGRGSANVLELLGRLQEYDYRGWATVSPQHDDPSDEELPNAVAYLRSV